MSLHLLYGLCTYVCVGVCVERKKRVIDRKVLTGSWIINQTNRKRSVHRCVQSPVSHKGMHIHKYTSIHTHKSRQSSLIACIHHIQRLREFLWLYPGGPNTPSPTVKLIFSASSHKSYVWLNIKNYSKHKWILSFSRPALSAVFPGKFRD